MGVAVSPIGDWGEPIHVLTSLRSKPFPGAS